MRSSRLNFGAIFAAVVAGLLWVNIARGDTSGDWADVGALATANNQFAADLYSQLAAANPGNIFFSPYSINVALAMTFNGASYQSDGIIGYNRFAVPTMAPEMSIAAAKGADVPELLAPAGDWEAMRAAAANGADAVYFGLSAFNARHRAANFSLEELPQVIEYLHSHNVRGYVALNTLIFSDELVEVVRFIKEIVAAGVDAIIVQDLGLAELAHRMCPELDLHGSTQMTLTEAKGIDFVHRLGVSRVVLARELSTADIKRITAETPVPVEVFIHGALCVSYSGQCLTSESLGGRSANRGQCAQACRLPYDLVVDGNKRELGDKAYLLSPQDLAAHDLVGSLADLGVVCLKIEGRLKSAQYVAATTQTYRAAVDAAAHGKQFKATPQQSQDLAQSFSRGFTHGFLDGVDHQTLVHARFSKSRGIRAGKVVDKTSDSIIIRLLPGASLKPGDGVVFDEGHPEQDEQGGRITEVLPTRTPGVVEAIFFAGAVNPSAIAEDCEVWKTNDPDVRRRLERSFNRDVIVRRVAIKVEVVAEAGKALSIAVVDDKQNSAEVSWDRPLEKPGKFPMTRSVFCQQFGRLGDTPFELGQVTINGEAKGEFPGVMIPKSVLNDLRRQAMVKLLAMREGRSRGRIVVEGELDRMRGEAGGMEPPQSPALPQLHILARTMEQLEAALEWWPKIAGVEREMIYCEFEDVRQYAGAVKLAHAAGATIGLATVRVVKPPELGLLRVIAAAEPDAILVRNLAGLSLFGEEFAHIPLIGDYALNIANELTATIIARQNVRRMTASYDLNWKQMTAMLGRFSPAWFEAVIHQQMPMFHMEHCVFANALSNGKDYRDCGRPCEKHRVDLRDRAGAAHPLVADAGCRNTVFNGTAQSAAEFVPRMLGLGIRHFRVELLRQNAGQVVELLDSYAPVLAGIENGRASWRQLRVLHQLGVTRGTLVGAEA